MSDKKFKKICNRIRTQAPFAALLWQALHDAGFEVRPVGEGFTAYILSDGRMVGCMDGHGKLNTAPCISGGDWMGEQLSQIDEVYLAVQEAYINPCRLPTLNDTCYTVHADFGTNSLVVFSAEAMPIGLLLDADQMPE